MTLLIVDDLPTVVEGLEKSIRWSELGIDQVYTAYNALEARSILRTREIDVMLCDIQMPVESGLQLFQWMKTQEQLDVRVIFLTSHAEFEYAQQALKLGGFDYIIQPAPYDEVYEAVRRALIDLVNSREMVRETEIGRIFRMQTQQLRANALYHLLRGSPSSRNQEALVSLKLFPTPDEPIFPVLLHLLQWKPGETWEPGLLEYALDNVLEEIFEPYQCRPVSAAVEQRIFAIVLPQAGMNAAVVERQLYFLCSVCEQYFCGGAAVYFDEPIPLRELDQAWKNLYRRSQENITQNKGVFHIGRTAPNTHTYRMPEIKQWGVFLREGYPQALEESANALLDEMVKSGKITPQSLQAFYLDFLGLLYMDVGGGNNGLLNLIDTPEKMEIYRNGMKSVDAMRQLIRMVVNSLQPSEEAADQKERVEQIVHCINRYINEHLDGELKREELARQVNFSPDYMARIFKAEMGMTIKEYITSQKMKVAQGLLRNTNLPVSFVAAKVGYCNFSHFSYTYKKVMGVTPQEERKLKSDT